MRVTRITTDTAQLFPNQRAVTPERLYVAEQAGKAYILTPAPSEVDEDGGAPGFTAWRVQEFDTQAERDAFLRQTLVSPEGEAEPAKVMDELDAGDLSDEDDEPAGTLG